MKWGGVDAAGSLRPHAEERTPISEDRA